MCSKDLTKNLHGTKRFTKGESMTVTYYIGRKRNDLTIAKENTTPGTRSPNGIKIRMV